MTQTKKIKKILWIILGIAAVVIAAWLILRKPASTDTAYQTAAVQRGELLAVVGATGTVHANQTANLYWQTSGRVGEVNFSSGEAVAAGSTLASLRADSLPQSIILAQADLVAAQRNLEKITSSSSMAAQAQAALAAAQKELEWARGLVTDAEWTRASQEDLDNAREDLAEAESGLAEAQAAFDALSGKDPQDPDFLQAQDELDQARLDYQKESADLFWLEQGRWNNTAAAVNAARLATAQANYADALREWNRVKDGPTQEDISSAQARVDAFLATIGMASIKAPFDGTLTDVAVMPGDQAVVNARAFRIDDLSRLLVDVQVSEIDIASIRIDQDVVVTLDAVQGREYQGKVIQVAGAGETLAGNVNFKVVIEIIDFDEQVLPGMTAAVNIVVNRLEDVLIVPNRAIKVKDGQTYVYLLVNGELKQVEITMGASSDTQSEIIAGDIKTGDTLVLNPPLDFQAQGPFGMMR